MLDEWIKAVCDDLELDAEVDADLQLQVAKVTAHRVERRAAPITTFLIGLAAGRAGGDAAAVEQASRAVIRLARAWEPG
jgi:hypothetical protein